MSYLYNKLLIAIDRNELKNYLSSDPEYAGVWKYGQLPINDFYEMCSAINEYGVDHPNFENMVKDILKTIYSEPYPRPIVSATQLIMEQFDRKKSGKKCIEFIDEDLLVNMKNSLILNKKELETFEMHKKMFEPTIDTVYNKWDEKLSNNSVHRLK